MIGYVTLTVPVKRRHELVSNTMRVYSGLFNINGDFLVNESNAYEVLGASYDGVSQTPQRGTEFTENLINEHQSNWLIGDQVRVTTLLDDAGRVHEVGY